MGIFGRRAARLRLRRATEESLKVPTFSAPVDCTPWVIGDLWPTELLSPNTETETHADYLRADLQRIVNSANEDLQAIGRSGMAYLARRTAEARVIEEARALAIRRVDSTMRQLRQLRQHAPAKYPPEQAGGRPTQADGAGMDRTQILPAVREVPPPAAPMPAEDEQRAQPADAPADDPGLQRLLAFVARQEPRLNWALGKRPDGTTVLVTDLAHGWIPPGIAIPEGVQLLEPGVRNAPVSELLGTVSRSVTYGPADPTNWATDFAGISSSVQAMELPAVADLGRELGAATRHRDGMPQLVHTLVTAAEAGADIVEQEVDLLRVHLDTARYQVLAQYPEVDPAQLLNCMLLAATEGSVSGDPISANYHFAWFRKMDTKSLGEQDDSGW